MIGSIPIIFAVFVSGCVTSSPYKADSAHPIHTVSISKEVPMPRKMILSGLSESLAGALGGVVGVLATIFREGEDFRLPEVLRADLAEEIAKTGKFKVVSGSADAEVHIRVREYGFMQAGFMRRQVKPILTMETTMVRPDGSLVWKSGIVVGQRAKETPVMLPERLKDDPKVAAEALHAAARLWAAETAKSLR
jgi:hypothetical protein